MEEPQAQPIHWDSPKSKFNATLIFALVVAVIGLFTQQTFLVLLGLVGAGFNWFTNPKQFLIYENVLVVVYGKPRTKVVSYQDISHLELLVTPIGNRLRVRLINGKRMMVPVQDIDTFQAKLEEAMEKFQGTYDERKTIDKRPSRTTHPVVIEQDSGRDEVDEQEAHQEEVDEQDMGRVDVIEQDQALGEVVDIDQNTVDPNEESTTPY